MPKRSAGILPYRKGVGEIEVLLVHPGGPFWRNRDDGAWSLAKGEYAETEAASDAARREFKEETGWDVAGDMHPLGEIRQAGGKYLTAFALEAGFDPANFVSNSFELEWPPHSGRRQTFPEVDQAAWFGLGAARRKILPSQAPLLDRLQEMLGRAG
ncbi:MAG: NUDIX domain-containing protein [Parvibaculaceae bacterium]